MYKMIFSDLDETLLTSDHHAPKINQVAIAKARESYRLSPAQKEELKKLKRKQEKA